MEVSSAINTCIIICVDISYVTNQPVKSCCNLRFSCKLVSMGTKAIGAKSGD